MSLALETVKELGNLSLHHCNANAQRLTDRVLFMQSTCGGRLPWTFSAIANTAGFALSETCGMVMTVDGSGEDRTTLEGHHNPHAFMDTEESMKSAGGGMTGGVGAG